MSETNIMLATINGSNCLETMHELRYQGRHARHVTKHHFAEYITLLIVKDFATTHQPFRNHRGTRILTLGSQLFPPARP